MKMNKKEGVKNSIFFKTFLKLSLIMLCLVLLIHGMIYYLYGNHNLKKEEQAIENDLQYIENLVMALDRDSLHTSLEQMAKSLDINIRLEVNKDSYVFNTGSLVLFDKFDNNEDVSVKGDKEVDSLMIRSKEFNKGNQAVKVQVVKSLVQIKDAGTVAFSFMPYTIILALIISLICSYFYARSITDPIIKIEKTLQNMLTMTEDAKIDINRTDEIGKLSDSINQLYITLLQNINDYKASNEFISNMEKKRLDFLKVTSHELKTPVAKLSILLENMMLNVGKYRDRDKYLEEAYNINSELSTMLKNLLYNLRGNNMAKRDLQELSLIENVEESMEYYSIYFRSKELELMANFEAVEDVKVRMDRYELKFLLSNIFSNIAKHSREKSQVFIDLEDNVLSFYNEPNKAPQESIEIISKYLEESNIDDVNTSQNGFGIGIVKQISEEYNIDYKYWIEDNRIVLDLDFTNNLL